MIDLDEQHLIIIKSILRIHVPNCEIRVFGSRIKNTAKTYSDLDLALVCKQAIPWSTISQLKEDLAKSDLPIIVDIVDWHSISKSFQAVILEKFETLTH